MYGNVVKAWLEHGERPNGLPDLIDICSSALVRGFTDWVHDTIIHHSREYTLTSSTSVVPMYYMKLCM